MLEVVMVDAQTVAGWLAEGRATVIDVREPAEVAQARIHGARSLPLSQFDPAQCQPDMGSNGELRRLVLHCASGNRCGMAAQMLERSGHDGTVYRLEGGLMAWDEAGLPVDRGPVAET